MQELKGVLGKFNEEIKEYVSIIRCERTTSGMSIVLLSGLPSFFHKIFND